VEELIRQALLHMEGLGPHVAEGHYDLIGPKGEIILPRVWETTIKPDWSISMHMWPMPEPPRKPIGLLPPDPPSHGRPPTGGPPVIVNLTRDTRNQKSKVRGWIKRANKLLSNKDKDGML
jgi:hypothetical protein